MKKFILHWLDGKTNTVEGVSISDAFNRAGALAALDYWEELK